MGWVVPLHGHGAAQRNVVKRRIRELARLEILPRLDAAAARHDVLVRARREAYDTDYSELHDEIVEWLDSRWPPAPPSA